VSLRPSSFTFALATALSALTALAAMSAPIRAADTLPMWRPCEPGSLNRVVHVLKSTHEHDAIDVHALTETGIALPLLPLPEPTHAAPEIPLREPVVPFPVYRMEEFTQDGKAIERYIVEGATVILPDGKTEILWPEVSYVVEKNGYNDIESFERALRREGVLSSGKKLSPLKILTARGEVDAKGGMRRVFNHPTRENWLLKILDRRIGGPEKPPLDPGQIIRAIQREMALEPFLNARFARYGLSCTPTDFRYAQYGVAMQQRLKPGVSIARYRAALRATGDSAAILAFERRIQGIREEVVILNNELRPMMKRRFGGFMKKHNGKNMEELAIDFGTIQRDETLLGNCQVEEIMQNGVRYPHIECFDW
jgi:hypothetical protein